MRRRGATVARWLRWRGTAAIWRLRWRGSVSTLDLVARVCADIWIIFVSFSLPPLSKRSWRKIKVGRRQLVEVANIAVEVFVTPLFVLPFPLQVALYVQLGGVILFFMLSIQVWTLLWAFRFLLGVFPSPLGVMPARCRFLTVMASFAVIWWGLGPGTVT